MNIKHVISGTSRKNCALPIRSLIIHLRKPTSFFTNTLSDDLTLPSCEFFYIVCMVASPVWKTKGYTTTHQVTTIPTTHNHHGNFKNSASQLINQEKPAYSTWTNHRSYHSHLFTALALTPAHPFWENFNHKHPRCPTITTTPLLNHCWSSNVLFCSPTTTPSP